MAAVDEGTTAAKRKVESSRAQIVATRGEDKTEWLMEQLKQKDALIAKLTTLMEGVRQQLQGLQATLDQLKKPKAEGNADSENLLRDRTSEF